MMQEQKNEINVNLFIQELETTQLLLTRVVSKKKSEIEEKHLNIFSRGFAAHVSRE